MKNQTITRKLKLSKSTVSNLATIEQKMIKGGTNSNPFCHDDRTIVTCYYSCIFCEVTVTYCHTRCDTNGNIGEICL